MNNHEYFYSLHIMIFLCFIFYFYSISRFKLNVELRAQTCLKGFYLRYVKNNLDIFNIEDIKHLNPNDTHFFN